VENGYSFATSSQWATPSAQPWESAFIPLLPRRNHGRIWVVSQFIVVNHAPVAVAAAIVATLATLWEHFVGFGLVECLAVLSYHFLSPEQAFNLKTRTVTTVAASLQINTPNPAGASSGSSQVSTYPLTLTVTSALRHVSSGRTTTTGVGLLTSKDDPTKPPQRINFECDTGVFSRTGNNTYPARVTKPFQIKIEWPEIGSDKVYESTCKY